MGNAATATRSGRGRSRMRVAPGMPGMPALAERLPLLLHAVDELHELGRAPEVADARVGVGVGPVGGSPRSARKLVMPASRNSRTRRLASAWLDPTQVRCAIGSTSVFSSM